MVIGYREMADQLRSAIERGEYAPESTLPKQEQLAETFGVNVKTVRQAIALLESEGLVTPIRRRGTVVRGKPPMRRLGADRYAKSKWKFAGLVAFAADREATGRAWARSDQTNAVQLMPADAEAAAALQINPGDLVYERARLVTDVGAPTHTLTSYYRQADIEGTPLVDPNPGPAGHGGGFQVLTLRGLEPHRMAESIHARMPTPAEREQLKLPAGEPVVVLHRTTYTASDVPVEFARGVHSASRFTWTYEFEIPE